jgi:hypothetical protein
MPSCELSQTALLDLYLTAALLRIDTLSDVEHASEGIAFRVPDSTLTYTFERIAPRPFRNVLRQQIRDGLRSMTLRPVGLPNGRACDRRKDNLGPARAVVDAAAGARVVFAPLSSTPFVAASTL